MLTLEPAVQGTERVALFADRDDRSRYYYQPLVPRLSYRDKVPQLQLVEWRGGAGKGGMLNLTVNLGLDQDELDGIAKELRKQQGLREQPRLDPIPLVDGTVKLMLLGGESGKETDGPFKLKINQPARPALFGNNQAVFSVQLDDADSVSMVQRTLEAPKQGDMLPIGIVYSLRFLAMRQSYAFTLKANWEAVQKRLYDRFGLNLVFLQIAIENEVADLIEQKVIDIKETVVDGGPVPDRDRMVAEIKSAVLDTFFEPALLPPSASPSEGRLPFGFSRLRVDATQRISRTLGASITELTAVERAVHPAAYLAALTPTGGAAALISQLDPGRQDAARTVTVSTQGDFARDGIKSINVSLQYGSDAGNKKQAVLNKPDDQETVKWKPIVDGGVMKRDVTVQYDVRFDMNHPLRPPTNIRSPDSTTTLDSVVIVPRDMYRVPDVRITTLDSLWKDYREVRLSVKYDDAGVTREAGFTLTPEKRSQKWTALVPGTGPLSFSYQAAWTFDNLGRFATPWQESSGAQIPLRDPFPGRRTINIVPDFDWSQVSEVVAQVEYSNPARTIVLSREFEFSRNSHEPQTLRLPEIGSSETPIRYTLWVTYEDGRFLQFPPSYTEEAEDTITLTAALPHSRVILVGPQETDFAAQHLAQMQVDVQYVDPDNKLPESSTFTFDAPGARELFTFNYAVPYDGKYGKYQYRVTYQLSDGQRQTTDWQEWPDGETSADWVIPGPPPDTAQT